MNRQPFSRITFFLTAAYAVLLLSQPQAAVFGFTQGLLLCGNRVLPALFPFFVVSALLTALPQSRVLALPFRLITHGCGIRFPGAALILLLSLAGGLRGLCQTGGRGFARRPDQPPGRRIAACGRVLLGSRICHRLCGWNHAGFRPLGNIIVCPAAGSKPSGRVGSVSVSSGGDPKRSGSVQSVRRNCPRPGWARSAGRHPRRRGQLPDGMRMYPVFPCDRGRDRVLSPCQSVVACHCECRA